MWWAVAGLLLCGAEVLVNAFVLFYVGVAALIAAVAAYLLPQGDVPWFVFVLASIVGVVVLRPATLRRLSHANVATNAGALVGRVAVVEQPFSTNTRRGRVRVGGESWQAVLDPSCDLAPDLLEPGTPLIVQGIDGATLVVAGKETEHGR